tara:strand:+ start:818 stop:1969 length:1152 start_codon:yes stop_codon:yes gene_type:complete
MKNIGVIGCGNIAETYFRAQNYFNNIKIIACADINSEASKKCAAEYNITSQTVDEILSNNEVDIILNITIPQVHYEVSKRTLESGKHVYSEKPMSIKYEHAKELFEIANKKNLYFGNAPDTFLGGGGQLARELIDKGTIGEVLTGNFIFAFPGMQTCHPDPESWFKEGGGPVVDMGPYFFTALVNLLGPAKNVRGRDMKFFNNRIYDIGPKKGKQFNIEIPTTYMFSLEFHSNAIIQGCLSFDVQNHRRNHMELYGTKGSIIVPDPNMFGGPVLVSKELGSEWEEHSVENKPLGKTNIFSQSSRSNEAPQQSNYRGAGLSEMIYAMENNIKHRCNADVALHVVEMIESTMISAAEEREIEFKSSCQRPKSFFDSEIEKIFKKI